MNKKKIMNKSFVVNITFFCFLMSIIFSNWLPADAATGSNKTSSKTSTKTNTKTSTKTNTKASTKTSKNADATSSPVPSETSVPKNSASEKNENNKATKKIKVNITKCTLVKNTTFTLRVYNTKKSQYVVFKSDKTAIVTTKKNKTNKKTATIKANKVGTANIRTNIYSKKGKLVKSLKTSVKVTPEAISVKFTKRAIHLNVGDSAKVATIVKPSSSSETPVYDSSDPDIATVNAKGIVTGVSEGNAQISATILSNNQTVKCHISVDNPPSAPGIPD